MLTKMSQIEGGMQIVRDIEQLKEDVKKCSSSAETSTVKIQKTLAANEWDENNKQRIEDEHIKVDSLVIVSLPDNTPDGTATAFADADITSDEQGNGFVVFSFSGAKPSENFMIDVRII